MVKGNNRINLDINFSDEKQLKECFDVIIKAFVDGHTSKTGNGGDFYSYKLLISRQLYDGLDENEKIEDYDLVKKEGRPEEINGEIHYIFESKINKK